jgi:hypothetical protein
MTPYLKTALRGFRIYPSKNLRTIAQSIEGTVLPGFFSYTIPIGHEVPGKAYIKDDNEEYWVVDADQLEKHTEQREKP